MIGLDDVRAARQRIVGATRRTPMMTVAATRGAPVPATARLHLKLELLQTTGSFKARGAVNKARMLSAADAVRGLITASGGNHGLAVAYAGGLLGVPTTICLPQTVHPDKVERLKGFGAELVIGGEGWDASNETALALAARNGAAYIHPFADPLVVAGQGTLALEILEDVPETDTILVAIGGGGLISGIALAAKALRPDIRIVGVEPEGAPTLKAAREAGAVVTLPRVSTAAVTLAAARTDPFNFDIVQRHVDDIVLVSDDDMRAAARWLWSEFGIAAELSGAATIAALMRGRVRVSEDEDICALVCGAGRDGLG